MKYLAVFTIVAVFAVSINAQGRRGSKGRGRADTSLTEKSLSRNAIRQIEQQVGRRFGTRDVKVSNVQFNSYCGCTQLTFDMPQPLIKAFQNLVKRGQFQVRINNQPVYFNAFTPIAGAGGRVPTSTAVKTIKVTTSVTQEVQLSKSMIRQLQSQLSEAMTSQTGSTASFVVRDVDWDNNCGCMAVTVTTTSQMVQVVQSLIQNGYSININGFTVALTSLTVLSESGSQSGSPSSPDVQYGVVETSLADPSVTQAQSNQIARQVQESLGVQGSETPEVRITQIAFETSCACTVFTFEMAPELMAQFQSMIQNGYTVTVNGRSIAFYSLAVMTLVDGQMVVATPGGAAGACFSGDSEVLTPHGPVKMSDLREYEQVAVMKNGNELRFENVWWFIHKKADEEADFKVIQTESGNKMEITHKHLIPAVPCDINVNGADMETVFKDHSVFAEEVVPGTCVLTLGGDRKVSVEKVVEVGDIRKTGYYSPLTTSGTIIVDSIGASCYSHMRSHSTMHAVFTLLHQVANMFSYGVSNAGGELPTVLNLIHHAGMWLTSA